MSLSLRALFKSGMTRKIMVLLLASGTVPLIILAGVFFSFYFQGQKQGIIKLQGEICKRITTSISGYLEKTTGQIQLFADTLNPEAQNKIVLQNLSFTLLDQLSDFDRITVVDLEGKEVSKISRYYSFRPFEFKHVSQEESFKIAKSGKTHISRVELSEFSKFPHVQISVPIVDVSDRISGVLIVDVNVLKMWNYISKYSIGEHRYAYIVDSDGFLIAYQDTASVLQKKNLKTILSVNNLLTGKTGVFEYKGLTGESVIGANALIELTGWGVVVEIAAKEAYKNLYFLSLIFLAVFICTLMIAGFLGIRFSFMGIIQPINLLQKEAEAISQGDFSRKINLDVKDELGQLVEAFNRMTENLNHTTVSRDLLVKEVSERKKIQRALKKSEATLKSIFRVAPIGIGLVSDRVLLWVNDHMCNMIGYTNEELVGKSARMLYPTQDEFDFVGREKYKQINNNIIGTVETCWQRKDGIIIDILLSSSPLDPSDLSVGVTFTALDITQRKQAEEAKQVFESQLRQSRKMEAIGTLAGGIAHDFNNLLGIILGNAELAIDDAPESNPAIDNLKEILLASQRAKKVVRQLLNFARSSELERIPFQIIPVIKESLQLLRSSIPTTIEFRQNIEEITCPILSDPTLIQQVIINLCTNAAHAMENGGILTIAVCSIAIDENTAELYHDLMPGNYVKLAISDTGTGIDPEIQDRIFDPYFTTKDIGKGTGMGLSVVHGIVESNEGKIVIESELGKGSTFTVFLPLTEKEVFSEKTFERDLPTGNENILFVDDEEAIVDLGQRMLKRLGYKVLTMKNSVEALERFLSNPQEFDLLMTDMTMPQMTGDLLARKVQDVRPDMPIIVCTGFSERISIEKAEELSIKGYLEKPFDFQSIATMVRKVLDEVK